MREKTSSSVTGRSGFFLRLFGTLLSLGLLIYLLSQQGWNEIIVAVENIPLWRLFLALGLMIISRLAVAGRWHVLLRSAGIPIPASDTLRVTFAGLFSTNFLPTTIGGDVIRLAGAAQLGYDAVIGAASLVVDRLVGMAGMAMVLPFGLPAFLEARNTQSFIPSEKSLQAISVASTSFGKWVKPLWDKGLGIIREILEAVAIWRKQPRVLLQSLGFSWINMLGLFGVLSVLFTGLGDRMPFWLIAGLYSIVYFVTLMPFSINGYGIQEISITFIFSTVGGVSMQSALTVALLYRTLMMIVSLPGAVFVPGLLAGARKQAELTK